MNIDLKNGDCLEVLKKMDDNSVDSIVTDPPYGLKFMGKKWDHDVPSKDIWKECLRVLKPGGHLLAFAGTRTQHRMAVNIEDAGFEIRDMLAWCYGSGFPKSMDVSKAIDKSLGAERDVVSKSTNGISSGGKHCGIDGGYRFKGDFDITASATDQAKQWDGWGTALKPALEPITLARKPLIGTVVENVLKHGTGGLNIDACRIDYNGETPNLGGRAKHTRGDGYVFKAHGEDAEANIAGRFPANLIHDGSQEIEDCFGESSRFFYCAKASKKDREEGLENIKKGSNGEKGNGLGRVCETCGTPQLKAADCKCEIKSWINPSDRKNNHPTVKPTELMRYLCRLITPPNGIVLDPFMGSGSTGKAAVLEGFDFIGIELDKDYCEIAKKRIEFKLKGKNKP